MASETELLRLALKAYEAASEPELWPDFLKGYTETVSADFSVLQIHDLGKHISTVSAASASLAAHETRIQRILFETKYLA